MDAATKKAIGMRLRQKREQANYTREQLGELCSLSPRFIANIELGDSTFSLDSLMNVCGILSCSADFLLFGEQTVGADWADTIARLERLDVKYQPAAEKIFRGFIEAVTKAEDRMSQTEKAGCR